MTHCVGDLKVLGGPSSARLAFTAVTRLDGRPAARQLDFGSVRMLVTHAQISQ